MNKYNIKVGDYVETWDGGIGYITNIYDEAFDWMIVLPRNTSSPTPKGMITPGNFDNEIYKRIGANDFSKKKTKFKPINKYNQNGIITYTDKINELIDHINAIQERLNKYDSTRTN